MKSILRKPMVPHGIIIAAILFVVLISGVALASRAQAASLRPASGQRLITIYDQGQERSILTRATTLRKAFEEAQIHIDPSDLVEPGLDDQLVASGYDVNIYRARPVTIVDGMTRLRVLTPYQTVKQIVDRAGMTLHDEDTTTMTLNTDIVSQGPGIQLTINRATPFTLELYGKSVTAYTQAKTVADMMKSKNITLGKDDTISVPQSSAVTTNMTIEIWRNGSQTATQEQDIPFDTKQTQDADQPVGYKQVQTAGVVGKEMVTYEINMKNSQEVSRSVIQTVVTQQPTEQVEDIGTKVALPPGSHQDWMAAAGIASSDYGYVEYIVDHEGSWAPCKVQGGAIDCSYSGSMGYGIVQATPGSKMASAGSDWRTNPITQLEWATGYANGAKFVPYGGGWQGAYNYWAAHHNW
jgi:uncharacterized protein YabE (DUF348 family)